MKIKKDVLTKFFSSGLIISENIPLSLTFRITNQLNNYQYAETQGLLIK